MKEDNTDIKLTADAAIIVGGTDIILIKRSKEPFMDKFVLPGGHVDVEDKSVAAACARETEEEIGLTLDPDRFEFLMVLDAPDRDPRQVRRISIAYTINVASDVVSELKAETDAASVHVHPLAELSPADMGFDHYLVIAALRDRLSA